LVFSLVPKAASLSATGHLVLVFFGLIVQTFVFWVSSLRIGPVPLTSSFLSENYRLYFTELFSRQTFPFLPRSSFIGSYNLGSVIILMDPLTFPLMQPADEVLWKQAGLFEKLDSLESELQSVPAKPSFSNFPSGPPGSTDEQEPPASKAAHPIP
jgi:hypothetical protein